MKTLLIEPGCVSCGSCQAICPQVFSVKRCASVLPTADLEKYKDLIQEAIEMCPVQVIKYKEESNIQEK